MQSFREEILQQHLDDASFFADIRHETTFQPNLKLNDLAKFDSRIEANVRGLLASGEDAWEFCKDQWDTDDAGGLMIILRVALALERFDFVSGKLEESAASDNVSQVLGEALSWQDKRQLAAIDAEFVKRNAVLAREALYSARLYHRALDPETAEQHLQADTPSFPALSVRGVGEMGHRTLLPHCHRLFNDEHEEIRFWAAWSAVLVGDRSAAEVVQSYVVPGSRFVRPAIFLAPRVLETEVRTTWLRDLAQEETTRRLALTGCGIAGDPMYVPTLIHQMRIPEYARVAGEAFSMITGVDLVREGLDGSWPDGFETGPTEDPDDEDVRLDDDEDLPWPDAAGVANWWDGHAHLFQNGIRYLCGQPLTEANCRRVLVEGYQRQRISAALELALMQPDASLFEWRAPGFRQQLWLGLCVTR